MENNTGIALGDHVQVRGGFEDGLTGSIVDIDLSGETKDHPRFTIYTDQLRDGQHVRIGGFNAARLDRFEPDGGWTDNTGFWEDGAKSWAATMTAPDGTPCQLSVRDNSTSDRVASDSMYWMVTREVAPGQFEAVDSGAAPDERSARQHAVRAVVWHGDPKGV